MPRELPLFPLDLVLLPSCRVSLHIFEERYKIMVKGCLEDDSEFGIVWGSDDAYQVVGCAAEIVEVVDRFQDGRMNIIIQGKERFRVLDRHDRDPYISGIVEPMPDDSETADTGLVTRAKELYAEALKFTLGWFRPMDSDTVDVGALSYNVTASLSLPLERQQEILEMVRVNARLETVVTILEGVLVELHDTHRKTTGNGKA